MARAYKPKSCQRCGIMFSPTSGTAKYCGSVDDKVGCAYGANLERAKKDYTENPEKYVARAKQYRAENPEKCRGYQRKYRAKNPEKHRGHQRKHHAKNREAILGRKKQYQNRNRMLHAVGMVRIKRTHKVCSQCQREKPVHAYYTAPSAPDGRTSDCKACHRQAKQARRGLEHFQRELLKELKKTG